MGLGATRLGNAAYFSRHSLPIFFPVRVTARDAPRRSLAKRSASSRPMRATTSRSASGDRTSKRNGRRINSRAYHSRGRRPSPRCASPLLLLFLDGAERLRHLAARRCRIGVHEGLDRYRAWQGRESAREVFGCIESLGPLEDRGGELGVRDAIEPQRAQPQAQPAVAHHVPAPAAEDEAVHVEIARGERSFVGAIPQARRAPRLGAFRQDAQQFRIRIRALVTRLQCNAFAQRRRSSCAARSGAPGRASPGRFRSRARHRRGPAHARRSTRGRAPAPPRR